MVYTELVANIGFKFQGAGELKQFEETLKSVASLAKEISGSLGGSGGGLGPLGKKLADIGKEIDSFKQTGVAGLRKQISTIMTTSRSWEEFGGAVGQMASRISPVVGLVANVASAATELAANLTRAAIQSAQLHNNQSISALGSGSKASNVAALARMYESMAGFSAGDAAEQYKTFAEKLQKSTVKGETPPWLSSLGVSATDQNGKVRDTAEVMMEAIFAAADRQTKLKNDTERDWSLSEDQRKKLYADQQEFDAIIKENFGQSLLGRLKQGGDGADWRKARSEGTARLPPQTKEDEARNQRIDREVNKFQQYVQALEQGVVRLTAIAVDNLLPWVNSAMELVSKFGKWIGFIPTTEEEKRNEMNRKVAEQQRRENVKATGEEHYGTVEAARRLQTAGGTGAEQAKALTEAWSAFSGVRAILERNRGDPANRKFYEEKLATTLQGVLTAVDALRAVRPDIVGGISQDTIDKRAGVSNTDFANDQRTIAVTVTANYNEKDVAAAVQRVVMASGANIPKGWNVATLGSSLTA